MPGQCVFRDEWLEKEAYASWLERGKSRREAFCKVCKTSICVATMGESAVKSHESGQKHKKKVDFVANQPVADISAFFRGGPTSCAKSSSTSRLRQGSVIDRDQANPTDVLKAEILWALKCVDSHYSMNSSTGTHNLFQSMFPDSAIAKSFQCGEKKCAYLSAFGIRPYLTDMIEKKIRSSASYVLLFDETLNPQLQEKQMDVYVRLWDCELVSTKFHSSSFLGHASASDILAKLSPLVTKLGHRQLIQLSMDGPNVNWKVWKDLQSEIQSATTKSMLETGTCGLHILHNAFCAGVGATDWDIECFLTSAYRLFKDTPARRDDFLKVAQASRFPLKFCSHRWLENVEPAERAIELLPNLVAFCSAVKNKTVSQPKSKYFQDVLKILGDSLIKAKLQFFVTIAQDVVPFLVKYQTDKPMIPFLATDLGVVIRDVMARFVKDEVLSKAESVLALSKIDFEDKTNHTADHDIDIGFSAKQTLRTMDGTRDKQLFRTQCRLFLIALLKKLMQRAPIKYPLVRNLTCLDPRWMSAEHKKARVNQLEQVLRLMVDGKRLAEGKCDTVKKQFQKLCVSADDAFKTFDPSTDRADKLFFERLAHKKEFAELWEVVSQVLLLSHGQASVERGFSVNKQTMVDNLSRESLNARRLIIQHVRECGGVTAVPITKELLSHASSARKRYDLYLDSQREEKEKTRKAAKRKAAEQELAELIEKKSRLEKDITALEKSANKAAEDAEKKGRLPLIAESNALRRRAKEKSTELQGLDKLFKEKKEALPAL